MLLPKNRLTLIITILVVSSLPAIFHNWQQNSYSTRVSSSFGEGYDVVGETGLAKNCLKHHRIAIMSTFGAHHDVYMTVAWTIERVMRSQYILKVYAEVPFAHGFSPIIEDYGLYHGSFHHPDELIPDLLSGIEENNYDLLILGTCEFDLQEPHHQALLAAWDALSDERKFKLVCVVHNLDDTRWQTSITEWSRRNAIRLLPISQHVADGFRQKFNALAHSNDPKIQSAGYEYIPIDVHVPILDVRDLEDRSASTLSNVAIQGSFDMLRRDYQRIFEDLVASLHDNPVAWGYRVRGEDQCSYEPDPELSTPPFHLYLLGSGQIEIPVELKNIVSAHTNLQYNDFYSLMHQMDVCLLAFAENGYYESQASSTYTMSLECDVPLLVTKHARNSYKYADDDRVVITRPAAMGEIDALKALRVGSASSFLKSEKMVDNHLMIDAVEDMMKRGWRRSSKDFLHFKKGVWASNEAVMDRILHDL